MPERSLVEQKFAAAAKGYATSEVHARGESLGRLIELTAPRPEWLALDVATGAGHVALALAKRVRHVTAVDVTEEMLHQAEALAREGGVTNIAFVRARAETLPFPDAAFDLVTCRIAPHHFEDVPAFVREVARVLKPGGIFGLVDNVGPDADLVPGASAAEIAAADVAYTAFEKLRDASHNRALALGEWQSLVSASGLIVTRAERLTKRIDLDSWARRMASSDDTIGELARILDEAGPSLAAFLKPEHSMGRWSFTLHEGLTIASKAL